MEKCPQPRRDCKYRALGQCGLNRHHLYWPRYAYVGQLEQTWRNLEVNTQDMRKCDHDDLHAEELPPPKPDRQRMIDEVTYFLGAGVTARCLGQKNGNA